MAPRSLLTCISLETFSFLIRKFYFSLYCRRPGLLARPRFGIHWPKDMADIGIKSYSYLEIAGYFIHGSAFVFHHLILLRNELALTIKCTLSALCLKRCSHRHFPVETK
jgi:hypothetical protein